MSACLAPREKSGNDYGCANWCGAIDLFYSSRGAIRKRSKGEKGHGRHLPETPFLHNSGRKLSLLQPNFRLPSRNSAVPYQQPRPRSEPAASEPPETKALPPVAVGSLYRGLLQHAPGLRPGSGRTTRSTCLHVVLPRMATWFPEVSTRQLLSTLGPRLLVRTGKWSTSYSCPR